MKTRRKINQNRRELSSEEISKRADFNQVMQKYQVVTGKPGMSAFHKFLIFSGGAIIVAVAGYFVLDMASKPVDDFVYAPTKDTVVERPYAHPVSQMFLFASEKGCNCNAADGSVLKVAANSFADKDGKPYKGDVKLEYTRYHDVFDVMMAGIPMIYDSAGRRHFETAGMFGLRAYGGDEELALLMGKEIDVLLASDNKETDFRNYYLNGDMWEYLGHSKIETDQVPVIPEVDLGQLELQKAAVEAEIVALQKRKPVEPKPYSKKGYRFDFDVLSDDFPEMKAFAGMKFEVLTGSSAWNENLFETVWDDIKVAESRIAGNYELTLTKNGKSRNLTIFEVLEGKAYQNALVEYKTRMTDYENIKKQKEAERANLDLIFNKFKEQSADSEMKFLTEKERKSKMMDAVNSVVREFRVANMGIFNCDRPNDAPKGPKIMPSFCDEDGNPLIIRPIYLTELDKKVMFTYPGTLFEFVTYNPKRENVLWGFTKCGKLAWSKSDKFPDLPEGTVLNKFVMETSDSLPQNATEVRKLIGI
ncbi:MAG: hypothetical protein KKA07_07920 [Bacteroidetes bacterium]|nr:hypothetical protein [Bacteroidota bacterium]MBU1718990.1 hypothetical protein [Bacteroidota bacterium]